VDVEPGTVIHAYGVVRSDAVFDLPDSGIGGAGVALLDAGPVSGIFSILPETAFGAGPWNDHAEDAAWLARVATEHQRVLGEVVRDTDVLPLRLPALYRDEVHLHRMLEAEATLFRAVLESLHDHLEWSVHLYLVGEPETAATERPATGQEYLRQRAAAVTQRQRAQEVREQLVRDAYGALADLSRQSVANTPQDSALSGRAEPMLLNSAHLVCRRHEQLFFAAVAEVEARLAPAGISVEVSGPWPPYNFVELGADNLEPQR
jgi:gas vesicle protein GvpL/GvpF